MDIIDGEDRTMESVMPFLDPRRFVVIYNETDSARYADINQAHRFEIVDLHAMQYVEAYTTLGVASTRAATYNDRGYGPIR